MTIKGASWSGERFGSCCGEEHLSVCRAEGETVGQQAYRDQVRRASHAAFQVTNAAGLNPVRSASASWESAAAVLNWRRTAPKEAGLWLKTLLPTRRFRGAPVEGEKRVSSIVHAN